MDHAALLSPPSRRTFQRSESSLFPFVLFLKRLLVVLSVVAILKAKEEEFADTGYQIAAADTGAAGGPRPLKQPTGALTVEDFYKKPGTSKTDSRSERMLSVAVMDANTAEGVCDGRSLHLSQQRVKLGSLSSSPHVSLDSSSVDDSANPCLTATCVQATVPPKLGTSGAIRRWWGAVDIFHTSTASGSSCAAVIFTNSASPPSPLYIYPTVSATTTAAAGS